MSQTEALPQSLRVASIVTALSASAVTMLAVGLSFGSAVIDEFFIAMGLRASGSASAQLPLRSILTLLFALAAVVFVRDQFRRPVWAPATGVVWMASGLGLLYVERQAGWMGSAWLATAVGMVGLGSAWLMLRLGALAAGEPAVDGLLPGEQGK